MIGQTLSMLGAMYDAIGPGLILAAALPFFAATFVLMVRSGIRRRRSEE